MLGVVGGMGPAATVDFLDRIVQLTPAARDQEHLRWVALNWPDMPDRSSAILARDDTPLEMLGQAVRLLNAIGCRLIAITCNTAHHWHASLQAQSAAPIVHIAQVAVAGLDPDLPGRKVAVFATQGTIASGFYQAFLDEAGFEAVIPADIDAQADLTTAIARVKAAAMADATPPFQRAVDQARAHGCAAAILACTELPLIAQHLPAPGLQFVDTSLELARECIARLRPAGVSSHPAPNFRLARHPAGALEYHL